MKKILVFIMSAFLFASLPASEANQMVAHIAGNYIVLSDGSVLEMKNHKQKDLLMVGEEIQLKKNDKQILILSELSDQEFSCKYIGAVQDKFSMVAKVFPKIEKVRDLMVELSNGDLFVIPHGANSQWSVGTCVLKVKTDKGIYLLDFIDGSLDYASYFGNVKLSRNFDIVVDVPEIWIGKEYTTQLILASLGGVSFENSIFGNFNGWHDGDEIVIQEFNNVEFAVREKNATLFLFHNLTQNKLAVGSRS